MFGQIASWLMEISYFMVLGLLVTILDFDQFREVAAITKTFEFLLIPLVQVVTSSPLRKFVFYSKSQ